MLPARVELLLEGEEEGKGKVLTRTSTFSLYMYSAQCFQVGLSDVNMRSR